MLILSSYISKTIRDRGKVKTAKMFSMSRSTKKFPTVENVRQLCEELLILLKCIFLLTFTAFGYLNNQREATLLQNVK